MRALGNWLIFQNAPQATLDLLINIELLRAYFEEMAQNGGRVSSFSNDMIFEILGSITLEIAQVDGECGYLSELEALRISEARLTQLQPGF